MTIASVDGRATWPFEPLYKFLHASLPAWRRPDGTLDIPGIADHLGVSAEAIYKWFRKKRLPNASRARDLYAMVMDESNHRHLESVPELSTFYDFAD